MKKTDLELLKGKKLDIRRSQEPGQGQRQPGAPGNRAVQPSGGLMARLLGKAGVLDVSAAQTLGPSDPKEG